MMIRLLGNMRHRRKFELGRNQRLHDLPRAAEMAALMPDHIRSSIQLWFICRAACCSQLQEFRSCKHSQSIVWMPSDVMHGRFH